MRMKPFRQSLTAVILFAFVCMIGMGTHAAAQVPGKNWQQYKTPEDAGFSSQKLAEIKKLYDNSGVAAVLIVYDGKVVASWGDVTRRYFCHSMRKSFMSALYGIHAAKGTIDLNKTLEELNIDDKTPLTKDEKQAIVKDLLKSRSGVYLETAAETQQMKDTRPARGSHPHNTFWYYNNWDFNVLGTILKQATGISTVENFKKNIADPIQMEDFRLIDSWDYWDPASIHPAYGFRVSARDAARFGLLYLRKGKWNDNQLIPTDWINESMVPYSETPRPNTGYGYLWWIDKSFNDVGGMVAALGVGNQVIAVLPGANMVVVQRVDTYNGKMAPNNFDLIRKILNAKISAPKVNPQFMPLQNTPSVKCPPLITLQPSVLNKYMKDYVLGDIKGSIKKLNGLLVLQSSDYDLLHLLPVSKKLFFGEDLGRWILFELDKKGTPIGLTIHPSIAIANFYEDILANGVDSAIEKYKAKQNVTFRESDVDELGDLFVTLKKEKEALEIFRLNSELNPRSPMACYKLVKALLKNGGKQEALFNLQKIMALKPLLKEVEELLQKSREEQKK
ncbi:MAG: serine hydrolase [Candidatus Omnitrophota bacterium]